jgi:hypothetical protein
VDSISDLTVLWEISLEGPDTALQALECVKSLDALFLNTEITHSIMLTVPVSYGDFSKANLKITKNEAV